MTSEGKPPKVEETDSDDDTPLTVVQHVQGLGFKTSAGSIFGYVAGTFAKQMSQQFIWYIGLGSSMLGALWLQGWVQFNTKKISKDLTSVVKRAKNEEFIHKF